MNDKDWQGIMLKHFGRNWEMCAQASGLMCCGFLCDEILKLTKLNKRLSEINDTCEKCGCTEFLCGHNTRG